MLAIVHACAVIGIDWVLVEGQVDFNPRAGVLSFNIVDFPDSAVRERAGIKDSGLRFPNQYHLSQ